MSRRTLCGDEHGILPPVPESNWAPRLKLELWIDAGGGRGNAGGCVVLECNGWENTGCVIDAQGGVRSDSDAGPRIAKEPGRDQDGHGTRTRLCYSISNPLPGSQPPSPSAAKRSCAPAKSQSLLQNVPIYTYKLCRHAPPLVAQR